MLLYSIRVVGNANSANYTSIYDFGLNICMKTLREMMDLIESAQAEGSEPDAYGNTGEKHECGSCDGTGIDTHNDECPECGGKGWVRDKQGVAEEQLEETTPDAMAKIDDLFRK